MHKALAEGKGFQLDVINYKKNGEEFIFNIICEPFFNQFNELIGFFAIQPAFHYNEKEKLLRFKELYKNLFKVYNQSPQAILVTDNNGKYVRSNYSATRIFGYSKDEIKLLNVNDLVITSTADELWNDFIEKGTQTGEVEIKHKNGKSVFCRYLAFTNVTHGYHLSILNDITKIKENELAFRIQHNKLIEANEDRLRLFSTLSHDIRTPLNSLNGLLNLYGKDVLTKEELSSLLSKIGQQTKNVEAVLYNILGWSKSLLQSENLELEFINLKSFLKENNILFNDLTLTKTIKIELNLLENQVFCNGDLLAIVFRNLIANAVKFSDNNTTITITTKLFKENIIQISIADQGMGIPADKLDSVFGLSYTTRGQSGEKGTGLGLDLCKNIVKKMKGDIWIKSEEGKGTVVYFTLPLKKFE